MTRVLIVDDQASFRTLLQHMLTRAGLCVVGSAASIPEAEALLPVLRPDLAVVDVGLPGLNGLEGTPRLLALLPGLRVIVVSAYLDKANDLRQAAMAAGAEAFYTKDDLDLHLARKWHQLTP